MSEAALSSSLPPSVRRASDPQHKTWATSDYIGFLRSDNKQKGSEEREGERGKIGTWHNATATEGGTPVQSLQLLPPSAERGTFRLFWRLPPQDAQNLDLI